MHDSHWTVRSGGKQGSLKAREAWPALQVSQQSAPGRGSRGAGAGSTRGAALCTQSSRCSPEAASGLCSAPPFLPPCEGLPTAPCAPPEAGGPVACPHAPQSRCVPRCESAQDVLTRKGAHEATDPTHGARPGSAATADARASAELPPGLAASAPAELPPGLAVQMVTPDPWPGC